MSNYTKSTNFATKDNLTPGDPLKIVRGTEIDTEFNNIATAVATKTDNSAAAITGGSITGITDLAVADGGTGASTAAGALNNLLPSQTSAANKYLQSDGTNASWDAVTLSTADITGTLPVANGGTGVTSSTGTGNVVLSNSPTLVTPALGTPASGTLTNATGLPISTGVSGLGTGVATFLGTPSSANLASAVSDETGSGALVFANSPTLVTPALGTPSALVGTNITGTASGLTAGNVTTNANLTGAVTSVGNATSLGSFTSSQLAGALTDETGSGSAVFATSPTFVTPILGTPTSATLTNATGLPLTTGVTGTLPTANGGTNLTSFTSGGVVYASSSSALATGSALVFDGTNLGVGASTLLSRLVVSNGSAKNLEVQPGAPTYLFAYDRTASDYLNLDIAGKTITFGTPATGLTLTSSSLYTASGISVGIGTSSPNTKLQVNGNVVIGNGTIGAPASGYQLRITNDNTDFYDFGRNSSTGYFISNSSQASPYRGFIWAYGGTAQATLDASGNVGLGVTPSAWASSYKALEIKSSGGLAADGVADVLLLQNAYLNSSGQWIRRNAQAVGIYNISGATHSWYQSASSTAGSAATLTQAMTLDANGSLVTGGTTVVTNNGGITATTTSSGSIATSFAMRNAGTANGSGSYLNFRGVSNTGAEHDYCYLAMVADDTTAKTGSIRFSTTAGSSPIERARITSGGYFKASNTGSYIDAGLFHEFTQTNNSEGLQVRATDASYSNTTFQVRATRNTTNNSFYYLSCYNDGSSSYRMRVADSGSIGTAGSIALGTTTPPTSGIGVQFPATQSASSDANTLDDYEEGSFNPTINCTTNSGTVVYSYQYGYYVKVGQLVWYYFDMSISSFSGASGTPYITMPFVNANLNQNFSTFVPWDVNQNFTGTNVQAAGYLNVNGTELYLFKRLGTSSEIDTTININTTGRISGVITYRAAS